MLYPLECFTRILENEVLDSPLLDWEIVARVDFGAEQKQELIELVSPRVRFARLAELLEHALEALSLEKEVRQRASGNGKVPSLRDARGD